MPATWIPDTATAARRTTRATRCGPSRLLAAAAALWLLGGCVTVGPDYAPPDFPPPATWNTGLEGGLRSAAADPQALARWWETLDDPLLSRLMERSIAANQDLDQARARVREARARRGLAWSGYFPFVDASGGYSKSRSSADVGSGRESELYDVGIDAGWEVDIFGGVRRGVEAADADLAASEEDLRDVLVSLLAEVALNYVEARTFQARLAVAEANIAAQEETYQLTRSRFEAGLSDELAVQQALYNLESSRAALPGLRAGLEGDKNRLAVLTGAAPGAVHPELEGHRPIPVTPPSVAVGVPAETLRRRPDVRRSERLLAAASARIGVATADLYPRLQLSGGIGLESLSGSDLFLSSSRFWQIGPRVTWNIFDAGAIRRNIEIQSALQEQTLYQYEASVLLALEEAENALTAFAEEQVRRESLIAATIAAQRAVDLSQDQYKVGLVDFSNVLDAQRALLVLQDQLAESTGTVTANLVRLYKALGGGWTSLAESPGVEAPPGS